MKNEQRSVDSMFRVEDQIPAPVRSHSRRSTVLLLAISFAFGATEEAPSADWPQILGPNRDGVAAEALPATLRTEPDTRWANPIGQGYAGPVVVGDRAFLFHLANGVERFEAFDTATGKSIYQRDFDANYRGGINPDRGPRCTPVIDGDLAILFGAAGVAHAVRTKDGQPIWTKDLYEEFGGRDGYFGAGSTPVVIGNAVVFNVGGRGGAGIVALDRNQGRLLWKATNAGASYSAATSAATASGTAAEQKHGLLVTRLDAFLVDPQKGAILGQRPFGQRGPTVNAATPLVQERQAFVTASYGVGAALIDLDSPTLESVWENDTSLSSQYNTPVYHEGHLYGIHGREDIGDAQLRCVEWSTGRVVWSERGYGVAHLLRIGDAIITLRTDGTLEIIKATTKGYESLAKHVLSTRGVTRALPAYSDGSLYIRDEEQLIAIGL